MAPDLRRIVLTALVAVPFAASAGVFLNGVPIDGVRDQTFEKATVRIDAEGNVHIDAPAYKVSGAAAAAPGAAVTPATAGSGGKVTRRYFLIVAQNELGATQYDIDVYVNSAWLRKLKSSTPYDPVDISGHLVAGKNTITLIARKDLTGGRRSASPQHYFRVLIGEGGSGGNKIMIENVVAEFKRTADQLDDVSREFTFVAR